jgi:hypothetical protein
MMLKGKSRPSLSKSCLNVPARSGFSIPVKISKARWMQEQALMFSGDSTTYSKIIIWVVDLDLHFRSQDPNPDPGVSVSRSHKN